MMELLRRSAERREYRIVSVALTLADVPLIITILNGWIALAWIAFVIAFVSGIVLTVLTYRRLRDASLSGWWLLPMIFTPHFGPVWRLASVSWWLSGVIALIPVLIGWFAPARNVTRPGAGAPMAG